TARISTMPRTISPICKSLISLLRREDADGTSSCLGSQLDGRIDVYRHDTRNALFLHGHADQMLGHLHRDLVVRDEQELRLLAHGADQIGIALGVGIVQGSVHL